MDRPATGQSRSICNWCRNETRSASVQGAVATFRLDYGCKVSLHFANRVLDEFARHLEHALQLLFVTTSVTYCVVENGCLHSLVSIPGKK